MNVSHAHDSILARIYTIEMSDGSIWGVPVWVIAKHRAEYFAKEYNGDVVKSLDLDTVPLFDSDDGLTEIREWACSEMVWDDVKEHAEKLFETAPVVDFQRDWMFAESTALL